MLHRKLLFIVFVLWHFYGYSTSYPRFDLELKAPIKTWDEAIPLGNGLLGGLLWGENNVIRLSLDRGDLWDDRTNGEKNWWKIHNYQKGCLLIQQGKFDEVNDWWDGPYNGVSPTKLPAGRIEIKLRQGEKVDKFKLNLSRAEGEACFFSGSSINVFYDATMPVVLIKINGLGVQDIDLMTVLDVYKQNTGTEAGPSSGGTIKSLGYSDALKNAKGNAKWYIQEAAEGLKYCVYLASKKINNETLVALTITSNKDAKDFLALAVQRCNSKLQKSYAQTIKPHLQWWKNFWNKSSVTLPDTAIQKQYDIVQYFYGAASHPDTPPMPLQGVWTADNGTLPPWKGDYHNDLNTQMTYIAYQESGRFEQGLSYLNYLWDRRDYFRKFAHEFFQTDGLACPGVMSYSGQPLGGWGQYSLSPTMAAWSAHLFYLHWLYSADKQFLATRAYPWSSEVGACMLGLLKPDENGILKLPLSSSPEIFDNSGQAWLKPNSNFDLMCLKMLFLSLVDMATTLDKKQEATKWNNAAKALGDYHLKSNGVLLLDQETELPESHRHLSNIIGINPFNVLNVEQGEKECNIISTSLKNWKEKGTMGWCGYSFSWMSCMQARVGNIDEALKMLEIYTEAFVLRNGFHANGDQKKKNYSGFTYRPFTLEGNFLASQAVHEMLLQSWSPTPGIPSTSIVRIFPAVSDKWADVSFNNLRAEGGYKVSAVRKNGRTAWFRIVSLQGGLLRLKDNFGGRTPQWNTSKVTKKNNLFVIQTTRNQVIEAKI